MLEIRPSFGAVWFGRTTISIYVSFDKEAQIVIVGLIRKAFMLGLCEKEIHMLA